MRSCAVTVCFTDPEDEAADASFHERWEQWHPNVPLITLRSTHRSIAKPIVKYLCDIEAKDKYHKLVVLIPEVQPRRFWDYLLFNQRGVMLDRAIRRGTANVVLCRLRYRLEQLAPHDAGPARDAGRPRPQPTQRPPQRPTHRPLPPPPRPRVTTDTRVGEQFRLVVTGELASAPLGGWQDDSHEKHRGRGRRWGCPCPLTCRWPW